VSVIGENLRKIRETIDSTLQNVGRTDRVTLVAVTKTVPVERIRAAISEGIDTIGENRVQEAAEKHDIITEPVHWHMVGHLQRNKVRVAVRFFEMVQSIDKIETAAEIEKRAERPIDVLLEINSSGEDTKSGVHPDRLYELVDGLAGFQSIRIRGLMTIGPFTDDERMIREAFSSTRTMYEQLAERYPELPVDTLSMGMSADYPIAIEEGSNMVRLGTALFGERRYH
jgi:hypothetical protein